MPELNPYINPFYKEDDPNIQWGTGISTLLAGLAQNKREDEDRADKLFKEMEERKLRNAQIEAQKLSAEADWERALRPPTDNISGPEMSLKIFKDNAYINKDGREVIRMGQEEVDLPQFYARTWGWGPQSRGAVAEATEYGGQKGTNRANIEDAPALAKANALKADADKVNREYTYYSGLINTRLNAMNRRLEAIDKLIASSEEVTKNPIYATASKKKGKTGEVVRGMIKAEQDKLTPLLEERDELLGLISEYDAAQGLIRYDAPTPQAVIDTISKIPPRAGSRKRTATGPAAGGSAPTTAPATGQAKVDASGRFQWDEATQTWKQIK